MSFRHPEKLCLHQSLLYSPSKGGSITSLTPVRAALEVNNQPLFSSPSSFHLLWPSVFCSSVRNSLTFPMQFPSSYLTLPTNLMQHSSCKGGSEESWLVEWKPGRSGRGAVWTCSQLRGTAVERCRPPDSLWLEHTQAAIVARWRSSGCPHDFRLSIACASTDQWVRAICYKHDLVT